MRKRLIALSLIGTCLLTAEISATEYLDHIKYLSSPELRGRGTGTPELEKAARYLAKEFKAYGVPPAQPKTYLQSFPVTTSARLGTSNRFHYTLGKEKKSLAAEREFQPFNFSEQGPSHGSVVFAGYGITAKEYNYDDYENLDVNGKFVLILRHEPQEADEKSVFAGRNLTQHAQFDSKAINAKMHGARGVILINDVYNHGNEPDDMEKFGRSGGPSQSGIFFVQVKSAVAEEWISAAGKNLKDIEQKIDQSLKPQSFALPDSLAVDLKVDIRRDTKIVHNVAAYIPGETEEYVIVGAHYDHLGLGEQFSLAPSLAGTIHPGADDNASGTAGVLELGHWFAKQPKQKRGVLLLCFAGEELGLLGSAYYVRHPLLPLEKAVAMINMDMIGRLRDGKVFIGGSGTGSTFKALLDTVGPHYKMKTDLSETIGYGSSDHTSFTAGQVPVLFFFSGLHADYHKPSDTWDKIDAPAAVTLLNLVAEVITNLETAVDRPKYVRVVESQSAHGSAPPGTSSSSGYGPNFGSIPDFAEVPHGVRFADVKDGSPAAKAGLLRGDILIEFDGKKIDNLYDFTYALRAKKAGDSVLVKVTRGTNQIEAKVLLTERK